MDLIYALTFIFLGAGGLMLLAVVSIRGHREMKELNQRIKELNNRLEKEKADD